MTILTRPIVLILKYIDVFQSEWQHEKNIWEGLPYPLPFYTAAFYFMHNNYNLLSIKFAPIMPAFCFLPSYYSNNFAENQCIPRIPSVYVATSDMYQLLLYMFKPWPKTITS